MKIMGRIALIGDNSVEYVKRLFDIWNNGDCAVLIDWRIPFETAYQMMLEAGVQKCFIETHLLENRSLYEYSCVSFVTYDVADDNPHLLPNNVRCQYFENRSSNEAVIIYSSGTTGKSKGIILSHYAITTNADAIIDYMKLDPNDCLYIIRSLSHSSTLTGELLVSTRARIDVVLAPTVKLPRYILDNINKLSVTILCLNPKLLKLVCDEFKIRQYDISSIRTIYCSGSVLSNRVYLYACEIFANINIYNMYGLTEAGPRVSAKTAECLKNNSVGKVIKGVEVAIVNDKGELIKNGEHGIIHVNTLSRYNGYVSGEEKHVSLYKGWLNTGDIGYIDQYEELHVVCRMDNVINIDSHKVYPESIEQRILELHEVRDCVVGKIDNEDRELIGCLYVSDKLCSLDIIKKLEETMANYEIPKIYLKVDSIPRNINGKIDRATVSMILSKSLEKKELKK